MPRARPLGWIVEALALVFLCLAMPVALIGLLLPLNEYTWMESDGVLPEQLPFDCDALLISGLFLFPATVIFLGGLLGFGYLALRRSSGSRLLGVSLSLLVLLGIGVKLPSYFRESARAADVCGE
ncbi:hypothetical protein [Hyalangium versicolor]|uniref:hypothetical protein n=1 Tax=Hyalangium versicolor TaxID=2861190 RepID=UPI001CCB49F5|nr:hypothetical protein [Hyalangium versicolor]